MTRKMLATLALAWAVLLAVITAIVLIVAIVLGGCTDRSPRPCERLPHKDTTGNVVFCDCTCSDDPRFACPTGPAVPVCWLDDGEGSSSDAG